MSQNLTNEPKESKSLVICRCGFVTMATFTLLHFSLKMHQLCCGYAWYLHYSRVFEQLRSLETLLNPFQFENSGAAFRCGHAEMEMFENDAKDTHNFLLIGFYAIIR